MGWALAYIQALLKGEEVQLRPTGHSMTGKINSGQLVTVKPLLATDPDPVRGDIVLCKIGGHEYLHLIKDVNQGQYLIGNNRGSTNGWTSRAGIFGIVIKVED